MSTAGPLDEMVDGQGGVRPHWRGLLGVLTELGRETVAERAARLDRAFEEEGVGSLLPGAAEGRRCDPIPLLLSEGEFDSLTAGLVQRARLFEAFLADAYGPQSLLESGALPPALIYANPAFLRPCRIEAERTVENRLGFYAADLVRGADGGWRLLADHTGWADGVASALENRRMLARAVPELFHPQAVRPLQPFFETWQDSLQRQTPSVASVALLTPGHTDPAWFEHVLLARELSCALVEGGDLTVRDEGLFLKTLRGLQPIGVLLRAMPGQMIDPLELAPDGSGVPGLLEAARGRAVSVVNGAGSGLAEAPALAAFLPDLARRLLGEELAIPGVPTSWLGACNAVPSILADPSRWAIRSAWDSRVAPAQLDRLSVQGRQRLLARVGDAPWNFAASAVPEISVAPCAGPEGMVPRPILLRLFLVRANGGWEAMQGGLVRALDREGATAWRLPERGLAKDLWVLAETPGALVGPPSPYVPPLAIRRSSGDLPSRVADNFFWLGRYLERLEGAARLQRAAIQRIVRPAPSPREMAELQMIAACIAQAGLTEREVDCAIGPDPLAAALVRAARESGPTSNLLSQVSRMTSLLRDRLTGEMYATMSRALRELTDRLRRVRNRPEGEELDELALAMNAVLRLAATVAGLAAENMVRGGGRLFLDLGRRIERGQTIADELATALAQNAPEIQPGRVDLALRLTLELRDSVIAYRSRYLAVLQAAPALDLVLADDGNPRGLAFQLSSAFDLLTEIAGGADSSLAASASTLYDEAQTMVRDLSRAPDESAAAIALAPRLVSLKDGIAELSDRVSRRYFALLPAAHTVGIEVQPSLRGAA